MGRDWKSSWVLRTEEGSWHGRYTLGAQRAQLSPGTRVGGGQEESPGPALVTPQRPSGMPTPSWSEQTAHAAAPGWCDTGLAPLLSPLAGVLQVLLPELLALAAQHGGPASP